MGLGRERKTFPPLADALDEMDLRGYRDEFPILAEKTYLNSCSLGALSTRVRAAVEEHLDAWDDRGASAWYDTWWDHLQETRASFAQLVNARDDEVALLPNVSSALAALASGLDLDERRGVVLTEMDFPTCGHQFHAHPGAQVTLVPCTDGVRVPPEAVEKQLGADTAALVTSHVFFTSGYVQDIQRLSKAAREAGALSIIDAYQGTGQLPTDVKEIGCDALITGGLKWLLGGTGIAYLYLSREAQDRLDPGIAGWFGDQEPFAFDITRFQPRQDARRFELGTPSLPSVYAGHAGLSIVHEVGPARIRTRQTELCTDLYERFQDAGFELATPTEPEERAGIVMVDLPDPQDTVDKLAQRGIIVDARPGRLRISPYFYNTLEETETVVDAVVEIEGRSHRH